MKVLNLLELDNKAKSVQSGKVEESLLKVFYLGELWNYLWPFYCHIAP